MGVSLVIATVVSFYTHFHIYSKELTLFETCDESYSDKHSEKIDFFYFTLDISFHISRFKNFINSGQLTMREIIFSESPGVSNDNQKSSVGDSKVHRVRGD